MKLKRFWFKFKFPDNDIYPLGLATGCGVTAKTYDDALQLLQKYMFKDIAIPSILEVIEDVDISALDKDHVLPNMEIPTKRGIWFPKGYK